MTPCKERPASPGLVNFTVVLVDLIHLIHFIFFAPCAIMGS